MRINIPRIAALIGCSILLLPPSIQARGSRANPLSTWEEIHETIHSYAPAIDAKSLPALSRVFLPDAVANYTGALSDLHGLHNISVALFALAGGVNTQHQIGTTLIDIHDKRYGRESANSTTYFTATLFGDGKKHPTSAYGYVYGQFRDALVKTKQGWRIKRREMVPFGTFVGNQTLFG